jgi:hypothetical protein
MTTSSAAAERFVRKTHLGRDEYRKNFRQLDGEVIAAVTSTEADAVTPLMSKIYLRLANASEEYWEREGVLRFSGGEKNGRWVTAWEQLVILTGVASATARKALRWMHEQGIVGYFARKNGVGIRIFLNRASSSIGRRPAPGQKNLRLVRASTEASHASADDMPFSDSFADLEVLETDEDFRAPKNGADKGQVSKSLPEPATYLQSARSGEIVAHAGPAQSLSVFPVEEIVSRLKAELEPALHTAARQAAAREHERTREWLEQRGLPKVARVAQHEAYNVLKKYGVIGGTACRERPQANVGRGDHTPAGPHPLTADEIVDLAGACVALLETKGQSVELTLSEMSAEGGGFLLPEDAVRVRERANSLLATGSDTADK